MDKSPQPKLNFSKPHTALVIRITINKSTAVMLGLILAFILIATWMPGYSKELRVFAQEGLNPASPQAIDSFSSVGTISFQGELRDQATSSTLPDGAYKLRFAIYDAVSDGTKVWPAPTTDYEDHLGVGVQNGLFNVLLGSQITIPTTVFDSGNRYLQIWVCKTAGSTCTDFDDLGRLPISSVAYTLGIVPGTDIYATSGYALKVSTTDTNGSAFQAEASTTSGNTAGVYGLSNAPSGAGLSGYNGNSGYGVYGNSLNGTGVYGTSGLASGTGVKGQSTSGAGVYGTSSSGNGLEGNAASGTGVYGTANMTGIAGIATDTSSSSYGVYGQNASYSGAGVYGTSTNANGTGVRGQSNAGSGVYGVSDSGFGVEGNSDTNAGLWGNSTSGDGVSGTSVSGRGISGTSGVMGMVGIATAQNGVTYGIYGSSASPDGFGVYSAGDAHVEGNLTWASKTSYISVPAAAFQPEDNSIDYVNDGYTIWHKESAFPDDKKAFFAPVALPHKAKLTSLSARVCAHRPLNAADHFEIRFLSMDNTDEWGGPTEVAFIPGEAMTAGQCKNFTTTTFTNITVDNSQYTYYLGIWLVGSSGSDTSNVESRGMFIQYEVSEAY